MDKDRKPFDVIDGGGKPYEKTPPRPHRKNKKNLGGAESFIISISRNDDAVTLTILDTDYPYAGTVWNISDELKTALIKELRENYDRLADEMIITALVMLQGVNKE